MRAGLEEMGRVHKLAAGLQDGMAASITLQARARSYACASVSTCAVLKLHRQELAVLKRCHSQNVHRQLRACMLCTFALMRTYIHTHMHASLQEDLSAQQQRLSQGLGAMEAAQAAAVAQASAALQALADDAGALQQQQARYEALQARLLDASHGLAEQQAGMGRLLELLLRYEAHGSALLGLTHPPDARLALLASVSASWVAERAALQALAARHAAALHAASHIHSSASTLARAASAGLPPVSEAVAKASVRSIVMGGGAAAVLWMLLRRRAAHMRREELFEALRRSVRVLQLAVQLLCRASCTRSSGRWQGVYAVGCVCIWSTWQIT
jgi:hypothetical protein